MPSMTLRPISGTGSSWSNIADAYDVNGTSTAATVKVSNSTFAMRAGTFDFDLSDFPSNAKITEAILTVNAKSSANSMITLHAYVSEGDTNQRVINKAITNTKANYTADVTDYIRNWIPSSEDDTSTTVSLAYGPPSKYLTLCNGIKFGDDYWAEEDSYVTTEFIDITNVKSMSFSFPSGYDDRELYLYSWYLSKDTNAIDKVHSSATLSQSNLESYRNKGYKYACAIVEAQYPYNASPASGEVLVNFTYLNDVTNTGWTYFSYPGVGPFTWDNDGEKFGSDSRKATEKWTVADLFPNNSTTVEFYIYNNNGSLPNNIFYDYWGTNGKYGGYKSVTSTSGTENGRSYKKITLNRTTIQNYKYIALFFSSSSDERNFEIVVKTGAAVVDQTYGSGSSTSSEGGTLNLIGHMTSTSLTTLYIYDITLNINYSTCETNLGNTSINSIYLGQTRISEVYLGTTLVYKKSSSSSGGSGGSGSSGVSEEVLTLYQGSPEQNSSSYDGSEGVVSTSPIDITNLKSLTVTITQTSDNSVYIMCLNEYNANKLFTDYTSVEHSMSLKSYTLSESDLNNFRTRDKYLGFTINSNTFWELYPSQLTVTAYYTYY